MERQLAIDKQRGFDIAVDNCIKKGILSKYLNENRRGVMGLFFGEFNMDTALEVAREESYDKGKMEGKMEGKIEGANEEKIRIAKDMKKKSLPFSLIAEITGISEKKIMAL